LGFCVKIIVVLIFFSQLLTKNQNILFFMPNSQPNIAKALLDNGIIQFNFENPFTFASGIVSPVYCDGRLTISNIQLRKLIVNAMVNNIRTNYPDVEIICGVATGSIALSAWIADIMELPLMYYRKPKGHGANNTLEGTFHSGQKVVVVEDVVSTGGSCLKAVDSLRESGLDVLGVSFIYSHLMPQCIGNFGDKDCPYSYLCNFDELSKYTKESGILDDQKYDSLLKWHSNPTVWQK
jgi:orotate phosphoribosyltransferase